MDRITDAEAAVVAAQADADALEATNLARLYKQVRAASTANVANMTTGLAVGAAIDGVTLVAGDKVLMKNQTSAWLNGVYVVPASGAPARATNTDSETEMLSALILVQEGTTNGGLQFQCTAYDATATSGAVTFADTAAALTQAESDINTAEADIDALEATNLARLFKQVRVATTANIEDLTIGIAAGGTVDAIELAAGDRVLVKNQTNAWLNGIYVVPASGAPARATDADSEAEMLSALVLVQRGTTGAGLIFQCTAYDITPTSGAVTIAARAWGA